MTTPLVLAHRGQKIVMLLSKRQKLGRKKACSLQSVCVVPIIAGVGSGECVDLILHILELCSEIENGVSWGDQTKYGVIRGLNAV